MMNQSDSMIPAQNSPIGTPSCGQPYHPNIYLPTPLPTVRQVNVGMSTLGRVVKKTTGKSSIQLES